MDKLLLNNTLKHVTIHNKLKEEDYCWKEHKSREKHKKKNKHPETSHKSRYQQKNNLVEQELSRQLNRTLKKAEYIEKRIETVNKVAAIQQEGMTAIDWWRSLAANEQVKSEDKWHHDGFESLISDTQPLKNNFHRKMLKSDTETSDASDRRDPSPPPQTKKKKKKSSKKKSKKRRASSSSSSSTSEIEWVPSKRERKDEEESNKLVEEEKSEDVPKDDETYVVELPPKVEIEEREKSPAISIKSDQSLSDAYSATKETEEPQVVEEEEEFQGGKLMEIKSKRLSINTVPGVFQNAREDSKSENSSNSDPDSNKANGWHKPHSKLYIPKASKKNKKKKKRSKKKYHVRSRSVSERSSSRSRSTTPVRIDKKHLMEKYDEAFMKKDLEASRNVNDFWTHSGWDEIVKECPDDAKFKKSIDKKLKKESKKKKHKKSSKSKKSKRSP